MNAETNLLMCKNPFSFGPREGFFRNREYTKRRQLHFPVFIECEGEPGKLVKQEEIWFKNFMSVSTQQMITNLIRFGDGLVRGQLNRMVFLMTFLQTFSHQSNLNVPGGVIKGSLQLPSRSPMKEISEINSFNSDEIYFIESRLLKIKPNLTTLSLRGLIAKENNVVRRRELSPRILGLLSSYVAANKLMKGEREMNKCYQLDKNYINGERKNPEPKHQNSGLLNPFSTSSSAWLDESGSYTLSLSTPFDPENDLLLVKGNTDCEDEVHYQSVRVPFPASIRRKETLLLPSPRINGVHVLPSSTPYPNSTRSKQAISYGQIELFEIFSPSDRRFVPQLEAVPV